MKISIVFPVINCLNYTKRAIETLKTKHRYSILIVDNGSVDGTQEWAKSNGYGIIENGSNLGLTHAWNQGLHWAREQSCDFVLLANNDVLFHEKTIDMLVQEFVAHPDWGMVTAVNERGWCQNNGGPEAIFKKEITIPSDAESPDFSCFMLRFSTIDKIGEFDEEFSLRGKAYFEDNDYHYRMKLAGLPARCTTMAPYFHYGSMTQRQGAIPVVDSVNFERNHQYYVEKWGGTPGVETYKSPFNR